MCLRCPRPEMAQPCGFPVPLLRSLPLRPAVLLTGTCKVRALAPAPALHLNGKSFQPRLAKLSIVLFL